MWARQGWSRKRLCLALTCSLQVFWFGQHRKHNPWMRIPLVAGVHKDLRWGWGNPLGKLHRKGLQLFSGSGWQVPLLFGEIRWRNFFCGRSSKRPTTVCCRSFAGQLDDWLHSCVLASDVWPFSDTPWMATDA